MSERLEAETHDLIMRYDVVHEVNAWPVDDSGGDTSDDVIDNNADHRFEFEVEGRVASEHFPQCPFVKAWVEKHADYQDLVAT